MKIALFFVAAIGLAVLISHPFPPELRELRERSILDLD